MGTIPKPVEPLSIPQLPSLIALPRATRPSRLKWLKWSLVAIVVVLLAVCGCGWRVHTQSAITYETVPLERGTIQSSVTATGTLNAVVDVLVGSQVSGNIKALYADWNTKVTKGQLDGGLAAAIGLMAWMEISAMLVFVGAAWNSESATQAD